MLRDYLEWFTPLALIITAIGGAYAAIAARRTSILDQSLRALQLLCEEQRAQITEMQCLIDKLRLENERLHTELQDKECRIRKLESRLDHPEINR